MEPRSVKYIAEGCGGELKRGCAQTQVLRACTDSRQAQRGDVFIAIRGENYDGHQFIRDAVAKGAVSVVVEQGKPVDEDLPVAVIVVENTRQALGSLGKTYRAEFSLPTIAVCGSNGKTTAKELIASVLKQRLNTLSSEASFNNDIGVPATLLKLSRAHGAAVLEAGTNHPGELRPLLEMIAPRFGVLTNIGREHLEFFGDLAGVAREEGQLAEVLPEAGKLFLNGDNDWAERVAARSRAEVVRLGLGERNDWRATGVRVYSETLSFRVEGPAAEWNGEYRLNLLGRHQVANALFAVALGCELGVLPDAVAKGLAECQGAKMRLQASDLNGIRVVNDAYNANADSMAAALRTLMELPCKGRRVAVLGDMAELGSHACAAHREVGRCAAELGVGQLFAVGKMAAATAGAAREAGLARVLEFTDIESAAPAVKSFLRPGDLLLLKASRSMRLERLAEMLRDN